MTAAPPPRRVLPFRAGLALVLAVGSLVAVVSPAAAACGTPQDGRYLGTWQSSKGLGQGVGALELTFSEMVVAGTVDFLTGSTAVAEGDDIAGTLDGCDFFFTGDAEHGPLKWSGSISADGRELIGTYTYESKYTQENIDAGSARVGLATDNVSTEGTSATTGDETSTADPLTTSVDSPTSGPIVIDEATSTGGTFPGYSLFDMVVRIEAPDATIAAPLALTFTLDSSSTNGMAAGSVAVFRNGVLIPDCTGAPQAIPDPCVSLREDLAGGGSRITVLTSQASTWNFGATEVPPLTATVEPDTGLLDGQVVAVSASGFSADVLSAGLAQCEAPSQCVGQRSTSVSGGSFSAVTFTVRRMVNGTDCAVSAGRCFLGVANLTGGGPSFTQVALVPLSFGTAPGPPAIVANPTAGDAQATVSWTPGSDGGSPIVGYVVTPYVLGVSQGPRYFLGAATSQTITGLTNGTTYRFKVRAWNAVGVSAFSSASNPVVPSVATVPSAPTIGSATAGSGSATVSWSAPASTGGSPIVGYVVTPYVLGVSQGPRYFLGAATSQTITGLTNGTTYRFKVRAWNAVGVSLFSSASNAVTPAL
jgi:hypothetical protein